MEETPAPQQTQLSPVPFGVVIAGRPVQNQMQQVTDLRWALPIAEAQTVNQITVFLTAPINANNVGLTVYISPPPYAEFVYLGAISNQYPSAVLPVRWPPPYNANSFQAQLILGLESAEDIGKKVSPVLPQQEEYKLFAKFIAEDLFRFMESFNKQTDQKNEFLLIPTKVCFFQLCFLTLKCNLSQVLDMWYEKFLHKFKLDPFFWTRKSGEKS